MRYARITSALAAAVLVLALAAPTRATTTRIPVSLDEPLIEVIAWSDTWGDTVQQARGYEASYAVDFGGDIGAGVATVRANYSMNLTTGHGTLWGTIVYDLGDGGFTGTFTGKWVWSEDAVWVGRTVSHGFGDLAGWQLRTQIVEIAHELVTEEGFIFMPGS